MEDNEESDSSSNTLVGRGLSKASSLSVLGGSKRRRRINSSSEEESGEEPAKAKCSTKSRRGKGAPSHNTRSQQLASSQGNNEDTYEEENAFGCPADQLISKVGDATTTILEVARKSGNLQGPFVAKLKRAAASITEAFDALSMRTPAEESGHLRVDNARLRRELASLKAELKSQRRELDEMRLALQAAPSMPAPTVDVAPQLSSADLVEEIRRSVLESVGTLITARLAGFEERLLPERSHRPPLAHDRAQDKETAQTAPGSNKTQAAKAKPKAKKTGGPNSQVVMSEPTSGSATATDAPTPSQDSWVDVVRKGKKTATPQAIAPAPAPRAVEKVPAKKAVKLSAPRSAAVILQLNPEAATNGITYADVLERAAEKVDLGQLGISDLRFRQAATGARILELPSTQGTEKADLLAGKLREALEGMATVVRPTKCADLQVSGLDDSATKEKVAAAVARAGGCPIEHIKVLDIRAGPRGMGNVVVQCPITVAKIVSDAGRLLVGWSSASVRALEPRPLRCYRCMHLGHTRPMCSSPVDRNMLCYRCGQEGHISSTCSRPPCCAVCKDAGKPSGHIMGGRNCSPPSIKGRLPGAASQTAPTPME